MSFLPVTKEEVNLPVDFVMITCDGYCDHPSFGHAIISRIIEAYGFTIGIIPQPQKDSDYLEFGTPKQAFIVSGGVVDSMVNNYTVAKKQRTVDVYSPGGKFGIRPDRQVTVYSKNIKRLFPNSALIIGGIEPSLRRFSHYDYWSDSVMPSIMIDTDCDLLVYGMGEKPFFDMLKLARKGIPIAKLRDIRGTMYKSTYEDLPKKVQAEFNTYAFCPSYEEVCKDKRKYVEAFNIQSQNNDFYNGKPVVQKHGKYYLVQNLPQLPLTVEEMDWVYALPYMRTYHPMYKEGLPAIEEVKYSITAQRGCFGCCNYCAITYHMGRIVQKRSKQSILAEAKLFTEDKDFKGNIHDVGGPTANFHNPSCDKQLTKGACTNKYCIGSEVCKNLKVDHTEYLDILRSLRQMEGIKRVFIRSGIRFDYLLYDKNKEFFKELIKYHVSGQLKVAPEHTEPEVLKAMNKPKNEVYQQFCKEYFSESKKIGKNQYVVPYLISSHPGSTLDDAINLALYLKSINYHPEQVQDFYPTPSTKSTCMYYTGINPDTMQEIYVPKTREEKRMQRALLQYNNPKNYDLIEKALKITNRTNLIGYTKDCLIKPRPSIAKSKMSNKISTNSGKGNASKTQNAVATNNDKRNTKKSSNALGANIGRKIKKH